MKYKNFIFITNTAWENESPRCRHQIALECCKIGQVYFIQKDTQSKQDTPLPNLTLLKTPNSNIHRKLQLLLPWLKKKEDIRLNQLLIELIKSQKLTPENTLILNFRYDFSLFKGIEIEHIYICNDEFTLRHRWPINHILTNIETNTSKNSKACFAISTVLEKKLKQYNPRTYLFKPGITNYKLKGYNKDKQKISNKTQVCYGGYINDRLDFDIIESLVKSPNIDVEIFGPVHGDDTNQKLKKLKKLGLTVSAPKNYEDFINYLNHFDVLIAPYRVTLSTSASSMPNKILQYLQTGNPVVISPLPHLDSSLKKHIAIASKENWFQVIENIIQEDTKEKRRHRIEFAKEHTWETSVSKILKTTESL